VQVVLECSGQDVGRKRNAYAFALRGYVSIPFANLLPSYCSLKKSMSCCFFKNTILTERRRMRKLYGEGKSKIINKKLEVKEY